MAPASHCAAAACVRCSRDVLGDGVASALVISDVGTWHWAGMLAWGLERASLLMVVLQTPT